MKFFICLSELIALQALSLFLLSAYYKFLGGLPFVAVAALLLYVGCYQASIFFLRLLALVALTWVGLGHLLGPEILFLFLFTPKVLHIKRYIKLQHRNCKKKTVSKKKVKKIWEIGERILWKKEVRFRNELIFVHVLSLSVRPR